MISQLFNTFSQVRYSVVGLVTFDWVIAQGYPIEISKYPQDVVKTKGHFQQTNSGDPLPRKTSTHLIEPGKVELVPTCSFQPCVLVSLVWESILQATETQTWTTTQAQNLRPTICPDTKYVRTIVAQNFCKKPTNVWFDLRPTLQKGTDTWHF